MTKLPVLSFMRWLLLAVLLLTISLIIWIVGPLVSIASNWPLESERARWMSIGAVLAYAAAIVAWNRWHAIQSLPPALRASAKTPSTASRRVEIVNFDRLRRTSSTQPPGPLSLVQVVASTLAPAVALVATNSWAYFRPRQVLGVRLVAATLSVALACLWTVSWLNNRRYVDEIARRTDQTRRLVQATPNRASSDILPISPALDATLGLVTDAADVPWARSFGLNQEPKLNSAARAAYDRMLTDALLTRIALRMEEQLRLPSDAPESQYEALKTYLMLHDFEHFDAADLKAYVEADWNTQLGRSVEPAQRALLSHHLDAMLSKGAVVSPLLVDKELVEFHRKRLAAATLPQRIYNRMLHQGFGQEFPEFTAVDAAGPSAMAFMRASGEPLSRGVPGIFTFDGYHKGFQKAVPRIAQQLAEEQRWVLGVAGATTAAGVLLGDQERLIDEVRRIYLDQYATVWDAYIGDLRLATTNSDLSRAIQIARVLSSLDSPLAMLLKAISHETTLLDATGELGPGQRSERIVDNRFTWLRRLVSAPEGGKAPLSEAISLFADISAELDATRFALSSRTVPPPPAVQAKLKVATATWPEPLKSMMTDLLAVGVRATQVQTRAVLAAEVKSQVGEFCAQAVVGRYPFDRSSSRDVTLADFGTLFGPGGKFETLFQQILAPHVDTSVSPWRFRTHEGVSLGVDNGTLPQFQRASTIREAFFPAGPTSSLQFVFRPLEADKDFDLVLEIDGQEVRSHKPFTVQWPAPRGSTEIRLQLNELRDGSSTFATFDGPWAIFRLLDRAKIEPTGAPERLRVTFEVDHRRVSFEVTTSSVHNPIRLRALNEFSCPKGL